MPFSLPIGVALAGQCVLTVAVFVVILTSFMLQLDNTIESQVLARVQERIATVRQTLIEPFVEGYYTLESLTSMSSAAPNRFAPTDDESPAGDIEFYRFTGSALYNGKNLMYIGQLYESDNGPFFPLDGLPIPILQMTTKNSDTKTYPILGGREVQFKIRAFEVNDTVYITQPKYFPPSYSSSATSLISVRMDMTDKRLWFNYPANSVTTEEQTIINTTTGLPQTIHVTRETYAQMAIYTTSVNVLGPGKRFKLKWLQMIAVNLSSVQPLLLSLTDKAKGEKDSYAALYDLGAASPSGYKIMAASHPDEIGVVNMTGQTYLPAGQSSSAKMNAWYADALALSLQAGSEEGSVRTKDGRFLSFAHIRHAASNLHLFAVVSTAEHKYFAEVRQLQAVMIAIGVCCGALVVGLGLLIIYFVSVPIRGLKEGMGLAATLQNEKVVPTRSFLSEINSLCVAFAKMNAMLTEAKAYMPASMLVRFSSDDDTAGDDDDEDAANSRREVSILKSSVHTSNSASRKTDWHYESTDHATTAVTKQIASEVLSHSTLRNRRVAVLAVNVRGFTALPDFAITTVGGHSTTLLDLITVAAGAERGVIDSFHGDHFVLSFNAVKPVGSPGRRAVQCAAAIHQALADTPYERLSMGASCGTAVVGSLGNMTQRRLSIIGGCYTKALRLQRAAASLERSVEPLFGGPERAPANCFHCLIDAPTQAECSDNFDTITVGVLKVVNVVSFAKTNNTGPEIDRNSPRSPRAHKAHAPKAPTIQLLGVENAAGAIKRIPSSLRPKTSSLSAGQVHAVVMGLTSKEFEVERLSPTGGRRATEGEWMYEMHHKSLTNPFRFVNEAMDGALRGGSEAVLRAARDRHAQLLQEGEASMVVILSLVISQLEKGAFMGVTAGKAPIISIISPDDIHITPPGPGDALRPTALSHNGVAEMAVWHRLVYLLNLVDGGKIDGGFAKLVTIA